MIFYDIILYFMMLHDNDVLDWWKSMGSCSEAFRLWPCNLYRLANLTWAFLTPLCLAMQQVLRWTVMIEDVCCSVVCFRLSCCVLVGACMAWNDMKCLISSNLEAQVCRLLIGRSRSPSEAFRTSLSVHRNPMCWCCSRCNILAIGNG
jgi:hypothetical protein